MSTTGYIHRDSDARRDGEEAPARNVQRGLTLGTRPRAVVIAIHNVLVALDLNGRFLGVALHFGKDDRDLAQVALPGQVIRHKSVRKGDAGAAEPRAKTRRRSRARVKR